MERQFKLYAYCLFVMSIFVCSSVTFAVTINVPNDYSTIQAAIDAASDGDIVLILDGTYTGDGNKNLDFGGKAITVRSSGGPGNCIIDVENNGRGFYFHGGEGKESVLSGVAIINTKGFEGTIGSGIICESSSPKIEHCIISNGQAENGGGINCLDSSSPNISNCIIENNNSDAWGAGIYCLSSSPSIINCTIKGNLSGTGGGGIILSSSNPTISYCSIIENSSGYDGGGGIYCTNSSPQIANCIISDNSATATHGSGIFLSFSSSPSITNCTISGNDGFGIRMVYSSSPSITNCVIGSNSGNQGGGISSNESSPIITNCIIGNNKSLSGRGGGIESDFSTLSVTNSTISGNSAGEGGGIASIGNPSPIILNSIFWGDFPEEVYILENSQPIIMYSTIQGGWLGTGNSDANPAFLDQANGDFHLRAYSPCIGAGTVIGAPDTDIAGRPRPNPPGSSPDMGAYEHSRRIRTAPPLNIFATEVGNRWTYEGTQQGNPVTTEREIIGLDQTSFPVETYVHEIKTNGRSGDGESYEKTPAELRLWDSAGYQFSSGLLAFWYPWEVGDRRESSANVVGYSGVSVKLTVDILSKGPLGLSFDTLEAYELRYQLQASGPGGTETDTFRWWVVPYIGVVKDEREDSLGELTSFAIGGGTITEDTDADNDNLKDYQEFFIYDTNWLEADTDFDGLRDGEEVYSYNADPLDWDTDSDGMADGWEVEYDLNYSANDANEDSDEDGFSNVQEYRLNSDPQDPESYPDDVDFVWDFDEDEVIDYFDNCLYVSNPGQEDSDGDGCGDACDGRPGDPNWLTISSSIAYGETPLCAMVLANGQYMFTCGDNLGLYELDVPLDEYGEITLYGFCSGFSPFKVLLTPTRVRNYNITMIRAPVDSREMEITVYTEPGSTNPDYVRVYGTVSYGGTPLCAMILANGQNMFSCGADLGTFDLEVPLDSNGEITLYCFCSGFAPYKDVFVP